MCKQTAAAEDFLIYSHFQSLLRNLELIAININSLCCDETFSH